MQQGHLKPSNCDRPMYILSNSGMVKIKNICSHFQKIEYNQSYYLKIKGKKNGRYNR